MTSLAPYCVVIPDQDADNGQAGCGVLITSRHVLTAYHCLPAGTAKGDELDLRINDVPRHCTVFDIAPLYDLALLFLPHPEAIGVDLPYPRESIRHEAWVAPVKPAPHFATLEGTVSNPSTPFPCVAGGTIRAIELVSTHNPGSFAGYSGGPVFSDEDGQSLGLLGIIVEQYPDRVDPDRSTTVLFAASIEDAFMLLDGMNAVVRARELIERNVKPALRRVDETASVESQPMRAQSELQVENRLLRDLVEKALSMQGLVRVPRMQMVEPYDSTDGEASA